MKYIFYIEGLSREMVVYNQSDEKQARTYLWKALSDEEKNNVVQIELIEVEEP